MNLPALPATTPATTEADTPANNPLLALRAALLALDTKRQELADHRDVTALLHGLKTMRVLTADLQVIARATEDDAARLLVELAAESGTTAERRNRRWTLPGIGLVQVRNQYPPRPWADDELVPALVRAALDPDGTGELPTALEAAERITTALRNCARMEWRTGNPDTGAPGLRTYGLDPDQYRAEPGEPRRTINITSTGN